MRRAPCLLLLLAACTGGTGPDYSRLGDAEPARRERLSQRRLVSDFWRSRVNSGFAAPTRLVVRDAREWEGTWPLLAPAVLDPAAPRPAFDPDSQQVVIVALGQYPTGGWGVEIDSVVRSSIQLTVFVTRHIVVDGCFKGTSPTRPVDAVMTPATSAALPTYYRERDVEHC